MIKALKELKKNLDAERSDKKYERDGEGRVVVNMTVRDDSGFLSVYSQSDIPVIDGTVADFIENRTSAILPREPLTLRIFSDSVDENEIPVYQRAICSYYKEKYYSSEREYRRNVVAAVMLALAGILALSLMIFLEKRIESAIWFEVIDIVAWVFLWEAVDLYFLENRMLKYRRLRYLAFVDMKVEGYPLKKIEN